MSNNTLNNLDDCNESANEKPYSITPQQLDAFRQHAKDEAIRMAKALDSYERHNTEIRISLADNKLSDKEIMV